MPDIAVGGGQGRDATDKGEEELEIEEEAANPKVARKPTAPTKAMVLAHEVHHADYREWCKHCRAGKGISHQHRISEREGQLAEFSIDYAFMTNGGQVDYACQISEENMPGMCPVVVGYDHKSRGIWALAVDGKGATESAVKWVDKKVNESGNRGTKVVIRSDQEESIVALKKAVAIKRCAETVLIESPVRDSQANGSAERAVRTWAAQVRTLRHHLEYRIRTKMSKDSALMTWLVSWAADVLYRYRIQSFGRTSYDYVTGHKGTQPKAIFGENIMSKFTVDKNRRN